MKEKNKIVSPLDSTDLIQLWSEHRDNIGVDKATYTEGVSFGMLLKSQVPCVWTKKKTRYTSVMPTGGIYIRGCNGEIQTSMIDIEEMDNILYCSGCGHRVKIST